MKIIKNNHEKVTIRTEVEETDLLAGKGGIDLCQGVRTEKGKDPEVATEGVDLDQGIRTGKETDPEVAIEGVDLDQGIDQEIEKGKETGPEVAREGVEVVHRVVA